ncbi:unnamed protein product [Schistosoma margrebowiei]|uniref:Uncharacterized protein n=1 Tax=Schistosoma margrebowiei TaxID=48269 RepID=A0A183MUX2_9TREM|nr:unnamed protein product [Schistosoma margrebowiei]
MSSSVQLITLGWTGPNTEIPFKWIESGTLVEYEVLGDCPNHNSSEACHGATSSTTCIWCEIANICITSNGKDDRDLKVNGCQIKNITADTTTLATTETDLANGLKKTNPSTESHLKITADTTTLATTETDLANGLKKTNPSTESHLNMTTDTTVDIGERKSSQYVYIVVPLVISFLIVCIGCGIWLWFHRRKRVYP